MLIKQKEWSWRMSIRFTQRSRAFVLSDSVYKISTCFILIVITNVHYLGVSGKDLMVV